MNINKLEMEWTDEGCIASAEGFTGVLLTCPRCQEQLPRGEEHRCGNAVLDFKGPSRAAAIRPKRKVSA